MKSLKPQDFDRAFAKTPAAIHDSIIEAFEKGERAMRFRHKITTMVSAAAALVVIVAVAALAAGSLGIGTPKEDRVLGQQFTAPPVASAGETIVYCHAKGTYYHARPSCSGMKNAPETTLAQAEADGKRPCPVCISIDITPAATPTPIPVHGTPEPTLPVTATLTPRPTPTPWPAAQNAELGSYSVGIIGGADGPTSIFITHPGAESEIFAYTMENTAYYHLAENCPDAQDCARTSIEEAQAWGKEPCPVCCGFAMPTPVPTPMSADPEEDQRQEHWLDGMLQVYATENGKVYHAIPDCSGMQNASTLLSKDGDAEGKQPCPNCIPDIGDSSFRRFFGTGIDEAFPGFTRTVATLGNYSHRHGAYLNYFAHMRLENADGDSIVIQLTPPANGLDGELELSAVGGIGLQALLDHSHEPFGDLTNELIPLYLQRRTGSAKSCPVSAVSVSFDGDEAITGCSTVLDIDEESSYLVHWPMKDGRFVLPEIEPAPMPEQRVFASEYGVYYHSDSSCAGMKDAAEMLRREAMQMGKQACPICMEDSAPSAAASLVQEDERVFSTPTLMPMSAVPGENPTFTPLSKAFSTILGLDFEDALPGYILDYAEGHPIEEGSGNAAYNMWQFSSGDRTLIISLLDAVENCDGVLSINFPDNAASFRMMKQAKEPLHSLYMEIAPVLADGLTELTGGESIGSRYLWDAFIHFNTRSEITTVELVYAMADASTIHLSWDVGGGEPRLFNVNWIG